MKGEFMALFPHTSASGNNPAVYVGCTGRVRPAAANYYSKFA